MTAEPLIRACRCGCGRTFATTNPWKLYVAPSHRPPPRNRGAAHARAAKELLRHPPHGAPCPRCGLPMTNEQWARGRLQAGHTVDLCLGGTLPDRVEHGSCNMRAGATVGNQLRGYKTKDAQPSPLRTSRRW